MNKESEDYLDQLLNSVQEQKPRSNETHKAEPADDPARDSSRREKRTQESIIRDFELSLEGLDEEQFISDFELSLEADTEEEAETEDSFFAGLGEAMNAENDEQSVTETDILSDDAQPEEQIVSEDSVEEPEPERQDENEPEPEEQDQDENEPENADDILSLLDGLGEDNEDLADIGKMLKADENGETVEPSEDITAESVAESLADLGFEVSPEDAVELASLEEIPPKQEAVPAGEEQEEKPKEKQGFLKKWKQLFFGPEEEEISDGEPKVQEELHVSDENLGILEALEGGETESLSEDDPQAKKKAKKEEKKQAAAAKKAEKAKAKEEKRKEKAAAKAAKPKKEKKPKVKDKTPPLPKKPVLVIMLLAVTILGGILILGKGLHRQLAMSSSKDYCSQGQYVKAYNKVAGLEIKSDNKKDVQYREKLEILAGVEELYDSYEQLEQLGRQELALDCLIRIIGHYDADIEKAGELGCSAELTEYEGLAEEILKDTYHTSFEEALRIYRIRSRVRYSTELVKILKEAGLDEWDR